MLLLLAPAFQVWVVKDAIPPEPRTASTEMGFG